MRILFIYLLINFTILQAQHFQGFEETSTRPTCWTGATFSNRDPLTLTSYIKQPAYAHEGVQVCGSGANASGLGGAQPNWLRSAAFSLTSPTTGQWVSFWYRAGDIFDVASKTANVRAYIENQATMVLTPFSSSINIAGTTGTTWTYVKYFFPVLATGSYKLVFEATSGNNRVLIDAIESSVNINGGPPNVGVSIVISAGANPPCGNPVTFTATVVNPSTPLNYQWKLNYQNVGSSSSTFTCDSLELGDSVWVQITTGTPCPTILNSNKIKINGLRVDLTSKIDDLCGSNIGALNINVVGGSTPYSYSWSNGSTTKNISGLAVGTYSVTATDALGCKDINTFNILGGIPITLSSTYTSINCNGGSNGAINITPGGGTTPLSYLWSNGATTQDLSGKTSGTYTVTITDGNSCTITSSYNLTEPAALNLSGLITHVNCNGSATGSVNITVSGGSPGYTFTWSSGGSTEDINSKIDGTYRVTITDNKSCTISGSYIITEPTVLAITAGTTTNVSCNGGDNGGKQITISGGVTNYSFIWSNGETTKDAISLTAGTHTVTVTDANSCTKTASYTITEPTLLTVSLTSQTHISCFGGNNGSINITASGGTTGYTYSWSNGTVSADPSTLNANTYTVTVTDNKSCTKTISTSLTEPSAIGISLNSITHVNCNGGTNGAINIDVSGGSPTYTYSWSNGGGSGQDISGRSVNTYTVTVTDTKSCTKTMSWNITQPTLISLSPSYTHINCNGGSNGSIDVTVSGGTTSYTYSWNTGVSTNTIGSKNAGTYTLTVTDGNGCTKTGSYILTQPASALNITLTGSTNITCGGSNGAINISVSGGVTNYNYLWNNSATSQDLAGLSLSGNYTITVTDAAGCIKTGSYSITETSSVSLSLIGITHVKCNGASTGSIDINPTGGTTPYSYLWSDGGTSQDATSKSAGIYTITITESGSCTSTASFTITQPTLLSLTSSITHVNCNGQSTGAITINVSGGVTNYSYNWSSGETSSSIIGKFAGIYSVTVTDANLCTFTSSFSITQASALNLSNSITHISCNGGNNGSISITASGGTSGYSYLWSGGELTSSINSKTASSYTITVTDTKGCTITSAFTITQPIAGLSISNSITHENCNAGNNGSVSISASGGTAGYVYLWSTGETVNNINSKTSGTYTITITDSKLCTLTSSFNITQPTTLNLSNSITHVSCNSGNNGSISITASGGTAGYTYVWSSSETVNNINSKTSGTYTITITDSKMCTLTSSFTITQPTTISLSNSITHVNCNGSNNGSISITANGGTSGYSYLWSSGESTSSINSKTASSYTVTVTDTKGCTITSAFTITQPIAGLSISNSITHVNCNAGNNGSVSISASGGTAGYTYLWSTGETVNNINSKTSGTYTITITDSKLCTLTSSFNITQPTTLSLSNSITHVNCNAGNNGSVSISASGGTAGYTYVWSSSETVNNINSKTSGTYTITITDSKMCTLTSSFIITQPTMLNLSNSITHVSCNGGNNGSITITASGGTSGYTYLWSDGNSSNGINSKTAGTYTITTTDTKSCSISASYTITQTTALSISNSLIHVSSSGNNDGAINITVSGGSPTYTYTWSNTSTTEDINTLTTGIYSVTVRDQKSCTITATYNITEPSPINIISTITHVRCNSGNNGEINIIPSGGVTPYTYSWSNAGSTATISGLTAGVYNVTITDFNNAKKYDSYTISQPTTLTITGSKTHISCNGNNNGMISIAVNGGTSPCTYYWTNGETTTSINNKIIGTYTVTVTDFNNCTSTSSFNLTQPNILTVNGTTTNIQCFNENNGSIVLTVNGGTSVYNYNWNTGISSKDINSLTAGTYTVTVTDMNSCTITSAFTITQPISGLNIVNSITHVNCNGGNNGTVNITASGGTSGYNYLWSSGETSNNINSKAIGNYSITVTDAKLCSITSSFTITQPTTLSLSNSVTHVSCNTGNNGAISISAFGGTSGYTYLWSSGETTNNINLKTNGNYTITIKDSKSCTLTSSFTVTQPTAISISNTVTHINCNSGINGAISIIASGGTAGYTYLWSSSETSNNIYSKTIGNYTVTVSDNNLCTKTSSYSITEPSLLNLSYSKSNVTFYNGNDGTIQLTVTGGTPIYTYSWSNTNTSKDINNLVKGFYTVTVTDQNLCTVTSSIEINQPGDIIITPTITSIDCNGNSNGAINISISGGVTPYLYSWSNGSVNKDINTLTANTYTVTVTDFNSISKTASFTITEPNQLLLFASKTDIACNGGTNGTIAISVFGGTSNYSYLWSSGETVKNISGKGAASYSLTVTDQNSCSKSINVSLTEPSAITIIGSTTDVSTNGASDGSISVVASGGSSSFSYKWSSGETNSILNNKISGNYTITITDANMCTKTASYSIFEPAPIIINGTLVDITCNNGNDGSISVTASGGVTPYTWLWSNGKTTSNITSLTAGNYSLTITDANNAKKKFNFTLTEPSPVNAFAGNDVNICLGSSTTLIASGGLTYVWNNGINSSSNIVNPLISSKYIVTVTNASGCIGVDSVLVTVKDLPIIDLGNTQYLCKGETTNIMLTSGFTNYKWYKNNLLVYNGNYPVIDVSDSGMYKVNITDSYGCTANDSILIAIYKLPTITITGNASICEGENTTITANGATNYIWSTSELTNFITVSPSVTTSYSVIGYQNHIGRSCSSIQNININVNPLPNPQIINFKDKVYTGQLNVSYSVTNEISHVYNWNITTGGTIYGTATNSVIQINWGNVPSIETITLTDKNSITGCTTNRNYSVEIYEPQLLTLTGVTDNISCNKGNDGKIDITVTGGIPNYQFNWSNGSNSEDLSALAIGTYTVTVTDYRGIFTTASFYIEDAQNLYPVINVLTPILCYGTYGIISVSIDKAGEYSYKWNTNETSSLINNVRPGLYVVEVTDILKGCKYYADTLITEPPILEVKPIIIPPYCPLKNDGQIKLEVQGGTPTYNFNWSNDSYNQDAIELLEGNYSYTITDKNGCSLSDTFKLVPEFEYCLEIPTAFSPNNDGENDFFTIKDFYYYYPNAVIEIYNRWGQMVFSSTGYKNPWNGTYRGYMVPIDTYHYVIDFKNGYWPKMGQVTIVK